MELHDFIQRLTSAASQSELKQLEDEVAPIERYVLSHLDTLREDQIVEIAGRVSILDPEKGHDIQKIYERLFRGDSAVVSLEEERAYYPLLNDVTNRKDADKIIKLAKKLDPEKLRAIKEDLIFAEERYLSSPTTEEVLDTLAQRERPRPKKIPPQTDKPIREPTKEVVLKSSDEEKATALYVARHLASSGIDSLQLLDFLVDIDLSRQEAVARVVSNPIFEKLKSTANRLYFSQEKFFMLLEKLDGEQRFLTGFRDIKNVEPLMRWLDSCLQLSIQPNSVELQTMKRESENQMLDAIQQASSSSPGAVRALHWDQLGEGEQAEATAKALMRFSDATRGMLLDRFYTQTPPDNIVPFLETLPSSVSKDQLDLIEEAILRYAHLFQIPKEIPLLLKLKKDDLPVVDKALKNFDTLPPKAFLEQYISWDDQERTGLNTLLPLPDFLKKIVMNQFDPIKTLRGLALTPKVRLLTEDDALLIKQLIILNAQLGPYVANKERKAIIASIYKKTTQA